MVRNFFSDRSYYNRVFNSYKFVVGVVVLFLFWRSFFRVLGENSVLK